MQPVKPEERNRPKSQTISNRIRTSDNYEVLIPITFVLIWSTGFIGAKLGLPYAEPFTFLSYRFALVLLFLLPFWLINRSPAKATPSQILHSVVVGILLHATQLGGVFSAIYLGLPAGIASLCMGINPLLTAILARPLLKENITKAQWIGLVVGLVGLVLVLNKSIFTGISSDGDFSTTAFLFVFAGLLGLLSGTFYQKAYCQQIDFRIASLAQYSGAFVTVIVISALFETGEVVWTGEFVFALVWLAIALSGGAVALLMILIRQGRLAQVASVFYLVPPVTACMGYLFFGETLTFVQIIGFALTAFAVWLAMS